MKDRTVRLLTALMLMLVAGGMLASCKKEIVKPNQIENNIVGDWDRVNSGTVNGTFDYKFYSDGEGAKYTTTQPNNERRIKYTVESDGTQIVTSNWNYTQEDWQAPSAPKSLSFPHKDTIVIDGDYYARM